MALGETFEMLTETESFPNVGKVPFVCEVSLARFMTPELFVMLKKIFVV